MTRWMILALSIGLLGILASAQAQETPQQVAFVNTSGQLVVTDADGQQRWIITQPNERLHPRVGYTWSPDGTQLAFAVSQDDLGTGDPVRVQLGDPATQQRTDLTTLSEPVSGGDWGTNGVYLAASNSIRAYDADAATTRTDATNLSLISPYTHTAPHLQSAHSVTPATNDTLLAVSPAAYTLVAPDGTPTELPLRNTADARKSGLWNTDAGLVALWGNGNSGNSLLVVNPTNQAILELTSSGSTPMLPLLWLPDSTQLVYRDPTGQIRLADVGCLVEDACGDANPLGNGTMFLPTSASEVQVTGDWVLFRDSEAVQAQPLTCTADDSCAASRVTLGTQAAPHTIVHAQNGIIVYTAYVNNPADPADREIRLLDSACLPDACTPRPFLSRAVGGMLSPDGTHLVANILDDGVYIVRLSDGNRVYLTGSDETNSTRLTTTRWNNPMTP